MREPTKQLGTDAPDLGLGTLEKMLLNRVQKLLLDAALFGAIAGEQHGGFVALGGCEESQGAVHEGVVAEMAGQIARASQRFWKVAEVEKKNDREQREKGRPRCPRKAEVESCARAPAVSLAAKRFGDDRICQPNFMGN